MQVEQWALWSDIEKQFDKYRDGTVVLYNSEEMAAGLALAWENRGFRPVRVRVEVVGC